MAEITVYGASDDLIEIEGDIREEFTAKRFGPNANHEGGLLAFSDGTVLEVLYAIEGVWRIRKLASGRAAYSNDEDPGDDEARYSDRVTLIGDAEDLRWCVFGTRIERAARGPADEEEK